MKNLHSPYSFGKKEKSFLFKVDLKSPDNSFDSSFQSHDLEASSLNNNLTPKEFQELLDFRRTLELQVGQTAGSQELGDRTVDVYQLTKAQLTARADAFTSKIKEIYDEDLEEIFTAKFWEQAAQKIETGLSKIKKEMRINVRRLKLTEGDITKENIMKIEDLNGKYESDPSTKSMITDNTFDVTINGQTQTLSQYEYLKKEYDLVIAKNLGESFYDTRNSHFKKETDTLPLENLKNVSVDVLKELVKHQGTFIDLSGLDLDSMTQQHIRALAEVLAPYEMTFMTDDDGNILKDETGTKINRKIKTPKPYNNNRLRIAMETEKNRLRDKNQNKQENEAREQKERLQKIAIAQDEARDMVNAEDINGILDNFENPDELTAMSVMTMENLLRIYPSGTHKGDAPMEILEDNKKLINAFPRTGFTRGVDFRSVTTLTPEVILADRPDGDNSHRLYVSDLPKRIRKKYMDENKNYVKPTDAVIADYFLNLLESIRSERIILGIKSLSLEEAEVLCNHFKDGERIEFHSLLELEDNVIKYLQENARFTIWALPQLAQKLKPLSYGGGEKLEDSMIKKPFMDEFSPEKKEERGLDLEDLDLDGINLEDVDLQGI